MNAAVVNQKPGTGKTALSLHRQRQTREERRLGVIGASPRNFAIDRYGQRAKEEGAQHFYSVPFPQDVSQFGEPQIRGKVDHHVDTIVIEKTQHHVNLVRAELLTAGFAFFLAKQDDSSGFTVRQRFIEPFASVKHIETVAFQCAVMPAEVPCDLPAPSENEGTAHE